MNDVITDADKSAMAEFICTDDVRFTNGPKCEEFERQWSQWLGVKHSIFVNSGTSANYMTMHLLRYMYGSCDVIVPPLTWVSDIASVVNNNLNPIFVDINLTNLSFDIDHLRKSITPNTKAIFLTHVLGLNGLTSELIDICEKNNILLIEDVCESHGATFNDKKVGSFGCMSNFSFYFAHHMSTIEGGMVCTDSDEYYDLLRAFRSHGMLRECKSGDFKTKIQNNYPDLNPDFIFLSPAYNFRSTELNAVLGISQLQRLDDNNKKRVQNFKYFITNLDSEKYVTDLSITGQCNYALIVILKSPNLDRRNLIEQELTNNNIEFRRGLSGGGNQLRQPYIKQYNLNVSAESLESNFATIEHVHKYSWYIGNYPELETTKIDKLLNILNSV